MSCFFLLMLLISQTPEKLSPLDRDMVEFDVIGFSSSSKHMDGYDIIQGGRIGYLIQGKRNYLFSLLFEIDEGKIYDFEFLENESVWFFKIHPEFLLEFAKVRAQLPLEGFLILSIYPVFIYEKYPSISKISSLWFYGLGAGCGIGVHIGLGKNYILSLKIVLKTENALAKEDYSLNYGGAEFSIGIGFRNFIKW